MLTVIPIESAAPTSCKSKLVADTAPVTNNEMKQNCTAAKAPDAVARSHRARYSLTTRNALKRPLTINEAFTVRSASQTRRQGCKTTANKRHSAAAISKADFQPKAPSNKGIAKPEMAPPAGIAACFIDNTRPRSCTGES